MSHDSKLNSQQEFEARQKQSSGGIPSDPIGFYIPLLLMALMMLGMGHMALDMIVRRAGLIMLFPLVNTPMAPLYGALLGGIGVCLLLTLWLKARRPAIAVTALLAILWLAVLLRYVPTDAVASATMAKVLVVLLALGIPVLLALWFVQPMEKMLAILVSLGWLIFWVALILLVRGSRSLAPVVLLFSLLASGAVFLPGLYIASGALLPLSGRDHWRKAFKYLRDHIMGMNYPAYVVVDQRYEQDKVEERVPGKRFSEFASTPGFVISGCDHAVVVSSGTKFRGVQGPGVTDITYADQITQTIDLRPQLRAFTVDAMTRDGIGVRVLAFAPVRIDPRGRQPELGEPLPYDKSAAVTAVHAQRMEHEGNGTMQRKWHEMARTVGERVLQNIISEYAFDDLYGPHQPDGMPPRKVIAERFVKQVRTELEPLGIQLVGGGISDLQPSDADVYVKRVRSWQSEWRQKVTLKQARGQADWLRTVERARAEAQADLILSLGRRLEELSAARAEFRPEAALQLLVAVLEELMQQQPTLGQVVPGETLQALVGIRRAISGRALEEE